LTNNRRFTRFDQGCEIKFVGTDEGWRSHGLLSSARPGARGRQNRLGCPDASHSCRHRSKGVFHIVKYFFSFWAYLGEYRGSQAVRPDETGSRRRRFFER
jgi:hypothetical protein